MTPMSITDIQPMLLSLHDLIGMLDAKTFFEWFINHASYLFVFVFMAVESSFIPFPSEVVVPPAAYLATVHKDELGRAIQTGDMNIVMVVVVATSGALVGSLVNYYLSMWIGRPIIYSFADSRVGHALLLDRSKVEHAEAYFDKHGAISTFVGRLIPAVRQLISIPAGLAKMNIGKFCLYTCLGAGLWNIVLAALGYWLAQMVPLSDLLDKVEQYNSYLTYAGIALALVCVGIIIYNAVKPRKVKDDAAA